MSLLSEIIKKAFSLDKNLDTSRISPLNIRYILNNNTNTMRVVSACGMTKWNLDSDFTVWCVETDCWADVREQHLSSLRLYENFTAASLISKSQCPVSINY